MEGRRFQAMKCPSCQADLEQRDYHDLVVDLCPSCKGVWFDAGELKEFIDYLLEDRDDIPPARIQLDKAIINTTDLSENLRRCPRCDKAMNKINYGYDSNIILDRCASCGGLWADREEILQLAIYKKGNPKLDALGKAVLKDKSELQALTDLAEAAESPKGPLGFQAFMPKIVLPLQSDRTAGAIPGVTFCLIAANVAAVFYEAFFVEDLSSFVEGYGLVPSAILSPRGLFSLVSSTFVHAGLLHLLVNMFFFWIFAPNVEDALGHRRFLASYFVFGLSASGLHVLTHLGSDMPVFGASGAIVMWRCRRRAVECDPPGTPDTSR